jgi:hypothetical protein
MSYRAGSCSLTLHAVQSLDDDDDHEQRQCEDRNIHGVLLSSVCGPWVTGAVRLRAGPGEENWWQQSHQLLPSVTGGCDAYGSASAWSMALGSANWTLWASVWIRVSVGVNRSVAGVGVSGPGSTAGGSWAAPAFLATSDDKRPPLGGVRQWGVSDPRQPEPFAPLTRSAPALALLDRCRYSSSLPGRVLGPPPVEGQPPSTSPIRVPAAPQSTARAATRASRTNASSSLSRSRSAVQVQAGQLCYPLIQLDQSVDVVDLLSQHRARSPARAPKGLDAPRNSAWP